MMMVVVGARAGASTDWGFGCLLCLCGAFSTSYPPSPWPLVRRSVHHADFGNGSGVVNERAVGGYYTPLRKSKLGLSGVD